MLYIAIALIIVGVSVIFFSFVKKEREVDHHSVIVRNRHTLYPDDDILRASGEAEMDGYGSFMEQKLTMPESATLDVRDIVAPGEDSIENTASDSSGVAATTQQDEKKAVNQQIDHDAYTMPEGAVKEGVEKKHIDQSTVAAGTVAGVTLSEDNEVVAVLFNDHSGELEYDGSDNNIDPTFGKYSSLKRVGRGSIEIVKDGINFKRLKNLYRFDFHRIRDIQGGDRFIAVYLKGSDIIRLFLFENENDYGVKIIRDYKRFSRKE
ncbi:MAG TPA: hypothetical protein PK544_02225 [Spirochaetota bacterium]|nr:hypothetical protein [Spirochaetota bacterium]HPJ36884.1 hypothetical protein [Spirochaetota bacterium]HPQ51950.1 hypothetical protein [Spirochaetota bacterium]